MRPVPGNIEALSFDCYGTLIDWEVGIATALGQWIRENGRDIEAERLLELYAEIETAIEAATPAKPYPEVLTEVLSQIGARLDVPVVPESGVLFANSILAWPAFPDAGAALEQLGTQYRLFVLSNVDRESFGVSAERLGINFDGVITQQDVGSYKPDQRGFERLVSMVEGSGIDRARLIHVAQSLFHDHVPAKQAGLSTVWINRRQGRSGWGATPSPRSLVAPDWEYSSMGCFADAWSPKREDVIVEP